MAIVSFKSRALRRLVDAGDARGIAGHLVERVGDILIALDQASRIGAMGRYPGWRLHPLYDVDLVDYH